MKTKLLILSALLLGSTLSSAHSHTEKPASAPAMKKYPLTKCIVSDEELGEMGKPSYLSYKAQIYGFCCKPCTKDFKEDPAKFAKKLQKLSSKKTKK